MIVFLVANLCFAETKAFHLFYPMRLRWFFKAKRLVFLAATLIISLHTINKSTYSLVEIAWGHNFNVILVCKPHKILWTDGSDPRLYRGEVTAIALQTLPTSIPYYTRLMWCVEMKFTGKPMEMFKTTSGLPVLQTLTSGSSLSFAHFWSSVGYLLHPMSSQDLCGVSRAACTYPKHSFSNIPCRTEKRVRGIG